MAKRKQKQKKAKQPKGEEGFTDKYLGRKIPFGGLNKKGFPEPV